jgi:hypothetical protein
VVHRCFPEDSAGQAGPLPGLVKCRIEFGWGPWKALGISQTADWRMEIQLQGARLHAVQPCFQSGPMDEERRNKVLSVSDRACRWQSYTRREGSFAETPTNAMVFEIEGAADSRIDLLVESPAERSFSYTLGDLAASSQVEFMGGFPCESLLVHRLVPEERYDAHTAFEDTSAPGNYYYARVTQSNGHVAWSSPVWVRAGPDLSPTRIGE